MTQALDRLDVDARFAGRDSARAASTPASAREVTASKFGIFAITYGISFALLYTIFERLNWPLFTYVPAVGATHFWKYLPKSNEGPPMFWYGWLTLAAGSAFLVSLIAMNLSEQWLRRATVFCCVLAALWPAALAGLQYYIVQYATFDADFLNSIWVAAIPAILGAALVTYFVSAKFVQRTWTSWLLIAPIGGLIVLGYSLKPWFVR